MKGNESAVTPSSMPPGRPRVASAKAAAPAVRSGVDRRATEVSASPSAGAQAELGSAASPVIKPQAQAQTAGALGAAQAAHLHESLLGLNLATALVCLVFGAMWSTRGFDQELAPWLVLGAVAVALRLALQLGYLPNDRQGQQSQRARRFLWLATVAATASGLMFGLCWVGLAPRLSLDEREALLLANVGLLLWSLQACSPYVPAFLAFALTSLVPAVALMSGLGGTTTEQPATMLGLMIVALLSLMFSLRFARDFRSGLLLQDRVQRLLDEVTAKRDEAVLATQAKSRFLASVSHDLRQPLHAMNLYLASVAGHFDKLRVMPDNDEYALNVHNGIRSLQDSTLYLNSMFESLLDISRLNAGSVAVNIRHTTLHRMLGQLEADYSRQAASQGMRFELRLPAQVQLMEVETDPALLERLLRNLLVNAFRYTRAGGVRLSVVARGRSLDFRVVDTGPGIERSMRKRVFEEFFQVPGSQSQGEALSPSSRLGGSAQAGAQGPSQGTEQRATQGASGPNPTGRGIGLGLSISARLADKLGAPIRLHSCTGMGSVFAFRQPMRIALRPQHDSLRVPARGTSARLPPGLFLAVIDDDIEIRRSTRQMLEVLGAEVFTAESAAQAVQQLGRLGRVPDLLLSDYRLGAENGVQAISLLREEFNQEIPAILITGDTSPERMEEFRSTGLRVLYKPISGAQLLEAVEEELQVLRPAAP